MDARGADELHGGTLEKFYATDYRVLCWNTHGSGLAGIRALDQATFHAISALAYSNSAEFALECSKIVLMGIGHIWEQDWRIRRSFELVDANRGAFLP